MSLKAKAKASLYIQNMCKGDYLHCCFIDANITFFIDFLRYLCYMHHLAKRNILKFLANTLNENEERVVSSNNHYYNSVLLFFRKGFLKMSLFVVFDRLLQLQFTNTVCSNTKAPKLIFFCMRAKHRVFDCRIKYQTVF